MLDFKVDSAAEIERIKKEIARIEVEISKENTRLANPKFVERAPAEIVAEAKKRIAAHGAVLDKLGRQLEKLKG